MKKLGLIVVALLLCSVLYANSRKVNVEFKDNTIVEVELSSDLVMKFTENELVFESENENNRFTLGDVKGFYYSGISSAVEDQLQSETFLFTGNDIQIIGLNAGTVVRIYDMYGKLIATNRSDGEFRMDISQLSNGVYILTYNNISRKFIVTKK